MTITRRSTIAGALTAAGVSSRPSLATDLDRTEVPSKSQLAMGPTIQGPRFNFEQAIRVMDELGVDGLVLGDGRNVYHLTGHWPLTSRMGFPLSTIAVLARGTIGQPALILPSFSYYFQLADHHDPDTFPVYIYTAPAESEEERQAGIGAPVTFFHNRGSMPMDMVEERRYSFTKSATQNIPSSANAAAALKRALKDYGLLQGVLATDIQELKNTIESVAPETKVQSAGIALSRIRPVKSAAEISLMRYAARANAEAALAAVKQVAPGMTYRELRALYNAEAAQRGNIGTFMVIDRISSDLYDQEIVDGQAFLIDAVSSYQGYHGDYGRTVFVGEPSASMRRATTIMGIAWDEVRESLRPGMRFSEIREKGQSTMKKLGFDYVVPFNPHSVGLFHTDHLSNDPNEAFMPDVILEKDMIISVDCPLLEMGVGGSAHLEDLVLITEQGGELLNDSGDQTIIV